MGPVEKMALDDFFPHIVNFVFHKCSPEWQIRPRAVDNFDMTYITKGSARYVVNGVAHDLESGDLLCLSEGDLREAATSPQNLMQCYAIQFKTDYQKSKNNGGGGEGIIFPMVSRIGLRQDIIRMFRELTICWVEQQPGDLMKSRALLMLIVNRLLEIVVYNAEPVYGDFRINKVIRYISQHYREKLSVKDLAGHVNINPDYLGTLFKRETGIHVNDYIKKIRIDHAEDMLRSGKYKVSQVSDYCGFCDIVHFFRSFKSLRGFAPSLCIPKEMNNEE
jgi:AraC-like DNA-binding protein